MVYLDTNQAAEINFSVEWAWKSDCGLNRGFQSGKGTIFVRTFSIKKAMHRSAATAATTGGLHNAPKQIKSFSS